MLGLALVLAGFVSWWLFGKRYFSSEEIQRRRELSNQQMISIREGSRIKFAQSVAKNTTLIHRRLVRSSAIILIQPAHLDVTALRELF